MVNAPINIADIAEVAAVVIITTQANNDDDNHDEVNAPGDVSITAVAAFNHGPLDEANVETITEDNNENYAVGNADNEQAQDSTHTNRLLQSFSQQLWEKSAAAQLTLHISINNCPITTRLPSSFCCCYRGSTATVFFREFICFIFIFPIQLIDSTCRRPAQEIPHFSINNTPIPTRPPPSYASCCRGSTAVFFSVSSFCFV